MPGDLAGLTAAERTRRAAALTLAESERLKARQANGAARQVQRLDRGEALASGIEEHAAALREALLGEPAAERAAVTAAPEPGAAARRDGPPVITITIAGAPHSGKSVITHLIRAALAREGIATSGPAKLRSVLPRQALADLIWRGLSVELVKTERGAE